MDLFLQLLDLFSATTLCAMLSRTDLGCIYYAILNSNLIDLI